MTHHHHDPGHAHPSPRLPPSLLRFSLPARLGIVAAVAAVVWALVLWAIA
ncbi:hypothetical protein PQJ75_01160 [Rhodoplanes sp. TEM]|uniref:Uncharacterized protein n=1 Tax=Rhodoplanes tepidamans TaxID=200616 RepID=A0ABT5J9F7_RHOTP|nr:MULTISPECIES: hypothetical protein [Rhodoplanes]MDC7786301.1 hypothetical protein [Rhodoplanes tepidamans]MDC7982328.1 hypothetical protein [Rhodoplanes sp. TEM]MDQ0355100.1 hypothetical protein [Rhodoplanes tepidamans]